MGDAMVRQSLRGRAHASGGRHQRGVTLIEVLIAVLVVSVGLLGLAGLQTVSMQYSHSSYMRTYANNMAYDLADRMRANRESALNNDYDIDVDLGDSHPGSNSDSSSMAQRDLYKWWSSVDQTLPQPTAEVTVDGSGVATIDIEWLDDRAEEDSGNKRTQFTLETGI